MNIQPQSVGSAKAKKMHTGSYNPGSSGVQYSSHMQYG